MEDRAGQGFCRVGFDKKCKKNQMNRVHQKENTSLQGTPPRNHGGRSRNRMECLIILCRRLTSTQNTSENPYSQSLPESSAMFHIQCDYWEAFTYIQNFTPVMVSVCSWWPMNFNANFQHTKEKLKNVSSGRFWSQQHRC